MLCSCDNCGDINPIFNSLQQLGKNLQSNEKFNQLAEFFSALGNKERLIIINILKDKDRCVCELEVILDKSQPSISHHLRELEKLNLIRGWKKGKFTYYSLLKENLNHYINHFKIDFQFSP
jgi:ArsR family transcriptional regulator